MRQPFSLMIAAVVVYAMTSCQPDSRKSKAEKDDPPSTGTEWVSFFNGKNLEGWTVRGQADWTVQDGILTGRSEEGQGHIYADPVLTDLEVTGNFRISSQGGSGNSGLYFRANPDPDNPDGFPRGYEAQICHQQEAFTGWLWKPGSPTGEANEMLSRDNEWFSMRVKAEGSLIRIWVNGKLVMTHEDGEYRQGHFAIQCHNPGMTIEARELYYRDLGAVR